MNFSLSGEEEGGRVLLVDVDLVVPGAGVEVNTLAARDKKSSHVFRSVPMLSRCAR